MLYRRIRHFTLIYIDSTKINAEDNMWLVVASK